MKTMTKTTIRNASRSKLLDFIADLDSDYPSDLTIEQLRARARQCERLSRRWYGETIMFEEWASN